MNQNGLKLVLVELLKKWFEILGHHFHFLSHGFLSGGGEVYPPAAGQKTAGFIFVRFFLDNQLSEGFFVHQQF